MERLKTLLTDPKDFRKVAMIVWVVDIVLTAVIIMKVPYTEIDWIAYKQEVEGVLIENDYDYTHLKGDTGPLVYPAGFVWLYSAIWYVTDSMNDIRRAQWMFLGLYAVFMAVVYYIYDKTKVMPPWTIPLLMLSKRIHSIFVLRLFNDCFAMLFAYVSIALFQKGRWTIGCAIYSLGVSIKMNVLLYSIPLLCLLLKSHGVMRTLPKLVLCAVIQVVLAIPFLQTNLWGYLVGSFNLGRVFMFKWTVNWKFLDPEVFVSKPLAIGLLACHVGVLIVFWMYRWTRTEGGMAKAIASGDEPVVKLNSDHILTLMFVGNFIGIAFARSLHYQFYVWYQHTIPFLLWKTNYDVVVRLLMWVTIEIAFNVFPATPLSSAALQVTHAVLLIGLWNGWQEKEKVKAE